MSDPYGDPLVDRIRVGFNRHGTRADLAQLNRRIERHRRALASLEDDRSRLLTAALADFRTADPTRPGPGGQNDAGWDRLLSDLFSAGPSGGEHTDWLDWLENQS